MPALFANLCALMPELPDVTVYIERLRERVQGRTLESIAIANPFLLRTAEPPLASIFGQRVRELRRLGKRIAFGFENDHWLVLHLMIAGRLHWFAAGERVSGRKALATIHLRQRCAHAHRGGHAAARIPSPGRERARAGGPRARWARAARSVARRVLRAPAIREPHAQAFADRSHALQRHRQCLLRRDPALGPPFSDRAERQAQRRGDRAPVRGDPGRAA